MSDYMQLIGTETIANAASSMRASAERIESAVNNYAELVSRMERALTEHADRLELIIGAVND